MLTGHRDPWVPSSLFCFQTIPADVESPEFCLGLQTLLSLKVRRMRALDPHFGPDPKGWDKEVKGTGEEAWASF